MSDGEVLIDRDLSAIIDTLFDAGGDALRLIAAGLPDGDEEPSTSPLDPAPWFRAPVPAFLPPTHTTLPPCQQHGLRCNMAGVKGGNVLCAAQATWRPRRGG